MGSCTTLLRNGISGLLLILILVLTPLLVVISSFSLTVQNSESIPTWLRESGIYSDIDEIAITQIKAQLKNEGVEGDPFQSSQLSGVLSESEFRQIVSETFTPEWTDQQVGTVVDAVYLWLDGEGEKPNFEIDIADRIDRLVPYLIDISSNRLDTIPVCTQEQVGDIVLPDKTTSPFTVFSLPCIPAEVSRDELKSEVELALRELTGNQEIRSRAVLSSKDLVLDSNLKDAPKVFGYIKLIPYIAGTIIGVLTVLSLLITTNRKVVFIIWALFTIIPLMFMFLIARGTLLHTSSVNDQLYSSVNIETGGPEAPYVEKVVNSIVENIFQDLSTVSGYTLLTLISIVAVVIILMLVKTLLTNPPKDGGINKESPIEKVVAPQSKNEDLAVKKQDVPPVKADTDVGKKN